MTRARSLLLCSLTLAGCPTDPDPQPVALLDLQDLQRVEDVTRDAFAEQRPADATCDDTGWFVDPFVGVLEVRTELCDYVTLAGPTLEPLAPGDVITIDAYHDVLSASEPGTGYIGVALGGEVVWEWQTPIPSDPTEIHESFTVTTGLPAGADLQVHVHNHGPNSWELRAVMVTHVE
jgi:hypothetical protein